MLRSVSAAGRLPVEPSVNARYLGLWNTKPDERVGLRVDWYRKSFAILAQVVIRALCVETLVTGAMDVFAAFIALGGMYNVRAEDVAKHQVVGIIDSHETVSRVVLRCDAEACLTGVEVRAIEAFIAASADSGVA